MTFTIPEWLIVPIVIIAASSLMIWLLVRKSSGSMFDERNLAALAVGIIGLAVSIGFIAGRLWPW